MPEPKEDYLPYCNNQGVPLADFQTAFCNRCLNPTCQRSQAGSSLFEQRANSWKDRLFDHPATMEESDPRYATISAQRFLSVPIVGLPVIGARSQAATQSSWIDPRDLEAAAPAAPVKAPQPRKVPPPRAVEVEAEPVPPESPSPPPAPVEVEPEESVPRPAAARPPRQAPLQTPFQQGVMIGGAPSPTSPGPPKDAWAAPALSPSGEAATVLTPGKKIRFGK
jgi:hypothetical protein